MIGPYCIHPLTLKRLVLLDQWNVPTWALISFMGRLDRGSKLVRNLQGEQVVSAAIVSIPKTVISVTLADRIIIPGEVDGAGNPVDHAIIVIDPKYDFSFSHWEAAIA
jgi:hypothetical protein